MKALLRTSSLALSSVLLTAACTVGVEEAPEYGEVTLLVTHVDELGAPLSREQRTDAGDLVAALDCELHEPIWVDGELVADPIDLLHAERVEVDLPGGSVVVLLRDGDRLRIIGSTLLRVRSARRTADSLLVDVDSGRFEIQLTGDLPEESLDRFFATALVRLVRGEPLLANDCRPDRIFSAAPASWLCAPLRDALAELFGGECVGPVTADEWAGLKQQIRTEGKVSTCYDLWLVPRPMCEWVYDLVAEPLLEDLEPDADGNVCTDAFYAACAGEVDASTESR